MRLDHLLSRESGRASRLVLGDLVQGDTEFQYCSILRALRRLRFKRGRHGTSGISGSISETRERGGIAQLGEHLLCKQGVKGSNPFISTIWADSSAG